MNRTPNTILFTQITKLYMNKRHKIICADFRQKTIINQTNQLIHCGLWVVLSRFPNTPILFVVILGVISVLVVIQHNRNIDTNLGNETSVISLKTGDMRWIDNLKPNLFTIRVNFPEQISVQRIIPNRYFRLRFEVTPQQHLFNSCFEVWTLSCNLIIREQFRYKKFNGSIDTSSKRLHCFDPCT